MMNEETQAEIAGLTADNAALLKAVIARLQETVEALNAGQRHAGEVRQQAFVELAEELAAEKPEERERHIRRIIDTAQENRP